MAKPKRDGASPWDPAPTPAAATPSTRAACSGCGAAAVVGLAECPYCNVAYPGVPPGARCPGCTSLNASRRSECARCKHDLTRPCTHCQHASPLELVACWHCHRPFDTARPGATTADDPCHVLAALDDILDS